VVRRWFGGSNAATPFNPLAGVEKLLAARSSQEVCELGLKQAVLAVGAETRGYVVLGSDCTATTSLRYKATILCSSTSRLATALGANPARD